LFKQRHPGVTIKAEAAGSRDCARKISDLGRSCDVFASADYEVVENLLMPEHADFNILFATNEMAIAYTAKSNKADEINLTNWYKILLDDDVNFGRADPNSDPCGYRTVMVFRLAQKHYQVPYLADDLIDKHGNKYIRPKETDLLALLEAGEIDYAFIYRSVAQQHGLKILRLPDPINLRSPKLADLYRTARVTVTGNNNAQNRGLAEAYVALLLSPEGQAIMRKYGQEPIVPAQTREYDRVPARLRRLCKQVDGP